MKAIIVTGTRKAGPEWNPIIAEQLTSFPEGTIVLHGDYDGIDTLADKIAKECGHDVRPFPADWDTYGHSAGPIRNSAMLKKLLGLQENGYEIEVLAFHNNIEEKGGTHDMVKKSRARAVKVRVSSVWPADRQEKLKAAIDDFYR